MGGRITRWWRNTKYRIRNTVYRVKGSLGTRRKISFKKPNINVRRPRITLPRKFMLRIWQSLASLLILFMIVGIFQMENKLAQSVQERVRSTFSQENDYTAVIQDYLTFGWWLNSYDRMVFRSDNRDEAVPASGKVDYQLSAPVGGTIVQRFGSVKSEVEGEQYFHTGIDVEASLGAPIRAVKGGVVVSVANHEAFGRVVQIDHQNGLYSMYGHCSEILVQEGQEVERGQIVGKVGTSGSTETPKLYFELRERGELVDPLLFLQPQSRTGI